MPNADETAAIRSAFIEKTGPISQAEVLPRVAGRRFGMRIFDGDTVSFGDLTTRFQVSRARISTGIRILEERGRAKRISKPRGRQDFSRLAPNSCATVLQGIQKRTRATRADIAQTTQSLPPHADTVQRREGYADFYARTDAAVGAALPDFNQSNTPNSGQPPAAPKDQTHE